MILHRLRLINKDQRGFTLTELILAICISAIITAFITLTIFQVITGSARTNNHMTAVRQAQSAGFWVSHDAQMAQQAPVIVEDTDDQLESIALNWTDWANGGLNGDEHEVVYTLEYNKLQRNYSVNGEALAVAVVAEYINSDPDLTSCVWDGSLLTFTVTATVRGQTETRTYEVVPRPGS